MPPWRRPWLLFGGSLATTERTEKRSVRQSVRERWIDRGRARGLSLRPRRGRERGGAGVGEDSPWLPALEDVLHVLGAILEEPVPAEEERERGVRTRGPRRQRRGRGRGRRAEGDSLEGEGRRDVEEGPPRPGVKLERVVADVVRVGVQILRWKLVLPREILPPLRRADRHQKELDVRFVQSRLDVSSELNRKLPAQGSPEGSTEGDERPLVLAPRVGQSHSGAVRDPEDLAGLELEVLARLGPRLGGLQARFRSGLASSRRARR